MKISICIATYGEEAWRELAWSRAWPSCQDQGALEVLVFHDPDGTIASVRNELASTAKGDALVYCDADDELAPGYLDAMRRAAEQVGGSSLLTPAVQQIRKGKPGKPFFFPECDFATGNWLIIGTLVRRDLFIEVGGFHEHPHGLEDWNFWARCVKAGATPVKVEDAVYIAHWNAQSPHHQLQRDRAAYQRAYALAKADA